MFFVVVTTRIVIKNAQFGTASFLAHTLYRELGFLTQK